MRCAALRLNRCGGTRSVLLMEVASLPPSPSIHACATHRSLTDTGWTAGDSHSLCCTSSSDPPSQLDQPASPAAALNCRSHNHTARSASLPHAVDSPHSPWRSANPTRPSLCPTPSLNLLRLQQQRSPLLLRMRLVRQLPLIPPPQLQLLSAVCTRPPSRCRCCSRCSIWASR